MRARSVLVAAGAGLVMVGALVPMRASAQVPPPSTVPDLGLPPATTRPADVQKPGTAGGGSSRHSGGPDGGSLVAGGYWPLPQPRAGVGGTGRRAPTRGLCGPAVHPLPLP